MMFRSLCLTSLMPGALACPVWAQVEQVQARNPDCVVAVLQPDGYTAMLTMAAIVDPRVESASAGTKFVINFYGCRDTKDCTSLTVFAGGTGFDVGVSQQFFINHVGYRDVSLTGFNQHVSAQ